MCIYENENPTEIWPNIFLYKIVDKMGMLKVENIIALMLTLTVHILPLQLLE